MVFLQAKVSTWEMVKSGWENACTAADLQMGTLQFFTQPCCHAWYLSGTPQSVEPNSLPFSGEKNICQNFVENCILLCEEKWSHAFCSQLICLIPASDIRPCLKCHLRNTPIHPLENVQNSCTIRQGMGAPQFSVCTMHSSRLDCVIIKSAGFYNCNDWIP